MASQEFDKIYQKPELSEAKIADMTEEISTKKPQNDSEINALVQEVRHKVYTCIFNQCEKIRLLGLSQQIDLQDIYKPIPQEIVNRWQHWLV